MAGKVLIVDDLKPNLKLLEAKLKSEYYTVYSANNGFEAIELAAEHSPDIILLDVMMPGMDGFETCKRLKQGDDTASIPVIMVTALTEQEDKVKGLESGADDFITKPIDEFHLFARLRSLIRIKELTDELMLRGNTVKKLNTNKINLENIKNKNCRIVLIDDDMIEVKKIREKLESLGHQVVHFHPDRKLQELNDIEFDLVIVSTVLEEKNGLRISVEIKSMELKKKIPVIILVDENNKELMLKGLQVGIDDYLLEPLDLNELVARTSTLLKRKLIQDALRSGIENSISASVIDPLTKLYNRRYLESHLEEIFFQAKEDNQQIVIMTVDIDNFKLVNDKPGWGHDIGDEVLKEVASRTKNCVRDSDLAVRLGGEEFVVVLTKTNLDNALIVAERIRSSVADNPIFISAEPGYLNTSISIGISIMREDDKSPHDLMKRSDKYLYEAKKTGKNKVVSDRDAVYV